MRRIHEGIHEGTRERMHAARPRPVLAVALAAGALLLGACGGEKNQGAQQAGTDSAAAAASAGAATAGGAATTASAGEQVFQRCATCHQATGQGIAGVYPPLAGSEVVKAAKPDAPIGVVLNGLQGPITVEGKEFNGMMPPYGTGVEMTDEEVASVVTYIRQSWGNGASAATPQDVARVRAQTKGGGPLTADRLKALM